MRKRKLLLVAGARPNFMKVAPILRALRPSRRLKPLLVHTGQHYDFLMSEVFFRDLGIPEPDVYLGAGSGSHAVQTAQVLEKFEEVLKKEKPAAVVVVGDVNSTLAAALAASKMGVPVAHVEAGLRSFDRAMPEETNRILTDRLSDFLFVTEDEGVRNLRREGIGNEKIFHVGNVMIDALFMSRKKISRSLIRETLGVEKARYAVATLHRPSNVDEEASFRGILETLGRVSARCPVIYPLHPRARRSMERFGFFRRFEKAPGLKVIEPLGYADFMNLVSGAAFVLTDSGGIQEETTVLGVPCLTLRENTERPATVRQGTNELVGRDDRKIMRAVGRILAGRWKKGQSPRRWDGRAAVRIARILEKKI